MNPARPSAVGHGMPGSGGERAGAPSPPEPRNPPARAGSRGAAGGRTWTCRRPRGSCPDSLRPGKLPALGSGRKSNPTPGGRKIAKNIEKPCKFVLKRACACCHLRAMTAGVRLANARRSGGEKAEYSALLSQPHSGGRALRSPLSTDPTPYSLPFPPVTLRGRTPEERYPAPTPDEERELP